jgi:hypothetical protein
MGLSKAPDLSIYRVMVFLCNWWTDGVIIVVILHPAGSGSVVFFSPHRAKFKLFMLYIHNIKCVKHNIMCETHNRVEEMRGQECRDRGSAPVITGIFFVGNRVIPGYLCAGAAVALSMLSASSSGTKQRTQRDWTGEVYHG